MAKMTEPVAEVEGEGDFAAGGTTYLSIDGMTCGNCVRHVTQALQGVAGVRSVFVDLDAQQATVQWQSDAKPNEDAVIAAVKQEGFEAEPRAEVSEHGTHTHSAWGLNLGIGIPVTAALMLGEWVFEWGVVTWFRWFAFGAAALVQAFAGARFYRGAWNQLKAGNSNMDTLVALGSSTAFAYSAWIMIWNKPGHVYFMEAAAIITLISAGHWMESRVSLRASGALRKLLNLAPGVALRRNPDGTETEIAVSALREADLVVLRPGDRVSADGAVIEGASAVDESMLTGEPVPVDKKTGSEVFTGTINLNGRLVARVTAVGEATALAHIISAVQRAQNSRARIQRLGDRVSSVFVPIVVGVALLSALWWGLLPTLAVEVHRWLQHALWHVQPPDSGVAAAFVVASAVLIIACPCAMGLATPVAIMAGSNVAAERGILIRDGVALEKAGEVGAVLFDKTGTLTVGKPSIGEVAAVCPDIRVANTSCSSSPADETVDERLRRLAAALAQPSSHPISRVVAELNEERIDFLDWQEIHGAGVQGRFRTDRGELIDARLGSLRWLRESDVDLQAGVDFTNRWSSRGATIVGVSVGRTLTGLIAVQDTLKPGAATAVRRLQQSGLKTYLITGDNAQTAKSIAQQSGIPAENVFAEVRPEHKADLVRTLQAQGDHVAFVGDGINDAPALEQADLGIAVSRASDIAREAADVILLKSEIEAIPESLGLARATLRAIKQNLFWAFFYNALGIPLAALGFMSPILCAAAMGLSDLVVIGNALRLRRWRL
jgi:Cu+-exporting ATPase